MSEQAGISTSSSIQAEWFRGATAMPPRGGTIENASDPEPPGAFPLGEIAARGGLRDALASLPPSHGSPAPSHLPATPDHISVVEDASAVAEVEQEVTSPDEPDRWMPGSFVPKEPAPPDDDPTSPEALEKMQEKIKKDNTRPVNPEKAAHLFNKLRRYGRAARGEERAQSNADLMKAVTDADVAAWFEAQGIDAEEVENFRRASFWSGLLNPSDSFVMNVASYVVAPLLAARFPQVSYLNLAAGALFQFASPAVNTLQRPGFVVYCERTRDWGGPTIQNKKDVIHDKYWPPELAKAVAASAADFVQKGDAFAAEIERLRKSAPAGSSEIRTQEQMSALLRGADAIELGHLGALFEELRQAEGQMEQMQRDLFMTEASLERQQIANATQIWPRALRSPLSSLVSFGRGRDPGGLVEAAMTAVTRLNSFSAYSAAGIQAALTVVLHVTQMMAAGRDTQRREEYNNLMNLMYGDFLTEEGKEKAASGNIAAEHIDQDKLRKMILSPDQAIVARMSKIISSKREKIQRDIVKIRAKYKLSPQSAAESNRTISRKGEEKIAPLEEFIEILDKEAGFLERLELKELDPKGFCAGLLKGNFSGILEDMGAKYRKPGELSAQISQRFGQTFHLGVVGSAGGSMIGKVGSFIVGGAEHEKTAQILGQAAGGAFISGIGAKYQGNAVYIKNNRRANEDSKEPVGIGLQTLRGILALPIMKGIPKIMEGIDVKVKRAHGDVTEALEKMQAVNQLAMMYEAEMRAE
jgi:hypothetical protein